MKICPICHSRLQTTQHVCPVCGTDCTAPAAKDAAAAPAPVDDDSALRLAALEEGLHALENAPKPTLGDTGRKMAPWLYGCAAIVCVAAGFATGAPIAHLAAAALFVPFVWTLAARLRKHEPLGDGEATVRAAARIFAEDAAALRERLSGHPEAMARIDAMQKLLDEAIARQKAGHAANRRKIVIAAAVVLVLAAAGTTMCAIRNHEARKAAEAYAMQPEWVKLRDGYLATGDDGEFGDDAARTEVIRAMLAAGETAEAETFFFDHCQGKVGDFAGAQAIAGHYRETGAAEAFAAFAGKIKLRYDSDTRKIKSMKP